MVQFQSVTLKVVPVGTNPKFVTLNMMVTVALGPTGMPEGSGGNPFTVMFVGARSTGATVLTSHCCSFA